MSSVFHNSQEAGDVFETMNGVSEMMEPLGDLQGLPPPQRMTL